MEVIYVMPKELHARGYSYFKIISYILFNFYTCLASNDSKIRHYIYLYDLHICMCSIIKYIGEIGRFSYTGRNKVPYVLSGP